MQTIQSVLSQATQSLQTISDSAMLDAEVLLSLALNKDRSYLRAWPEKPLSDEQNHQFLSFLKQRLTGIPIAYITGFKEFWSRDFEVTPDVLIPRPDTELLIEVSLKLLPDNKAANILDLGTGSGIIAITLAAERPKINVSACDSSETALAVAKRNAIKHNINNIQFHLSNWFSAIPNSLFNVIVSNPPYIAQDDYHLQQGDVRFEPTSALCASEHGLEAIQHIANKARQHLEDGGHLLIEHGYNQQHSVKTIFAKFHYENIQTFTDLAGQPRATYGQKPDFRNNNH
jgi:release factor glutamine methyltransferase